MVVNITSDEAIIWLRSHHSQTLKEAVDLVNLGEDMLRQSSDVWSAGGWHKLKEENPEAHAELHQKWLSMCRKHREMKDKLLSLCAN